MAQSMTINCPSCAAAMAVTDDYLAQYGGQASTCPACRAPFTVPTLHQPPPAMLGYANPYAPRGSAFNDGIGLVLEKDAVAPDRCVKCNAPANGYRWNKTFYWHPGAYYFLILFPGLLVYVIVALIIRKTGRISVGLCPTHRSVRNRNLLIAWLLFVVGLGLLVFGFYSAVGHGPRSERETASAVGVSVGLLVLLICGIFAAVVTPVVLPRKIDDQYVYLKRAGDPFLKSLPDRFI